MNLKTSASAIAGSIRNLKTRESFAIMKKEIDTYFSTPIAYIVISVFLIVTGWFFFSGFFIFNSAELRDFFQLLPIIFSLVIPAVTMRLFSEEKSSGSFEILMTLPVTTIEVVLGKLLAAAIFIAVMLAPTLFYAISVVIVGKPDFGPIIGGYIGALLLGTAFASVGILTSTLTKNQIVAFIIGLAVCFTLTLLDKMLFFMPSSILNFVEYLGADSHFKNIAKGVVDSRDIIYFLSVIGLSVLGSVHILDERR